jgi:hypothetical protein
MKSLEKYRLERDKNITVVCAMSASTTALFVEWIHPFQEKIQADTEQPVLLLLHNL